MCTISPSYYTILYKCSTIYQCSTIYCSIIIPLISFHNTPYFMNTICSIMNIIIPHTISIMKKILYHRIPVFLLSLDWFTGKFTGKKQKKTKKPRFPVDFPNKTNPMILCRQRFASLELLRSQPHRAAQRPRPAAQHALAQPQRVSWRRGCRHRVGRWSPGTPGGLGMGKMQHENWLFHHEHGKFNYVELMNNQKKHKEHMGISPSKFF